MGSLITTVFLSIQLASAAPIEKNQIYTGQQIEPVSLQQSLSQVQPGTVILVSEIHNNNSHHANQVKTLEALAQMKQNQPISVGMEFLYYPSQNHVNDFLSGIISEGKFLKLVGWGGNPFADYRQQVLFPASHGGRTLALNAPKALTRKISKTGLASLSPAEQKLLPPNFTLGNDQYKERFRQAMGGHVPEEKLANYFAAQSAWDDTMAWVATKFIKQNPEQILVIIVGDFHAKYFGGLPHRLVARGAQDVLVFSQVQLRDRSQEEINQSVRPHPQWGPRAHYIWTSH